MTLPADIRARVCAAATSSAARCAHVDRFGWRCMNHASFAGGLCWQHQRAERQGNLHDELAVLRDPRTGEAMEVE